MKGYIYKIKCNITNEIYIGSSITINNQRLYKHKNYHSTCKSKDIIDRGDYIFKKIDIRDFPNTLSLKLIENLYILICRKYCKCINKKIAYSTPSYRKQYIINWHKNKNYNLTKKEKDIINKKNRTRYNNDLEYKDKLLSKNKKWRDMNNEKVNNKKKEYNNKYNKIRVKCPYCNQELLKKSLKRHIDRKHI